MESVNNLIWILHVEKKDDRLLNQKKELDNQNLLLLLYQENNSYNLILLKLEL